MSTPSPMRKSQASRDYERLMRREISPSQYWETLKQEAESDVRQVLARQRAKAKAA